MDGGRSVKVLRISRGISTVIFRPLRHPGPVLQRCVIGERIAHRARGFRRPRALHQRQRHLRRVVVREAFYGVRRFQELHENHGCAQRAERSPCEARQRDDGVYENVTRSGGEARYMRRGEADSLPHLNKKIGD